MSELAIKPGSLVLVTGANGFIAGHIIDQVLQHGYRVRGTVRNISRDQWLTGHFEEKYGSGKFELAEVPDMLADGAFDEALKGVSGLIHAATPVLMSPDPNAIIRPVEAAVTRILEAAAKEPGVKRVVLTSSSSACTTLNGTQVFAINSDLWNEAIVEAAYAPPPYEGSERIEAVYAASKMRQEQAAWKWVREHKPSFVFNAVLPNANIGPSIDVVHQGYRSTLNWMKAVFEKGEKLNAKQDLLGLTPQYYVDVRDNAAVHVAALVYPDVKNERIFAFSHPFNANDLLRTLKRLYPERKFGEEEPNAAVEKSTVTNERGEELLKRITGHGWTSFETSVRDAAKEASAQF
ncbi:aldehyde reductase [Rostrohypoxylon terebratum]|nr:aldehyde reductase [Rostrohypoxylon terebratum]